MKRIFILTVLSLLSIAPVYAGQIQLSTYYPSPFGYYERLKFNPRVALTEPCEIGTVYYLAGTGLRYCDDTTVWKNVGSSVWTQNVNDIYPIDTTINPNLKVGIGTTTPEFRLTLDKGAASPDGGILAIGTYGGGATLGATFGAGTRLIWWPRKAAFRAGSVGGAQWNDANIGNYSVAMGVNTAASGSTSTAMGSGTTASGNISTATGWNTTASDVVSTATGYETTASGYASTAMGYRTTASDYASMAMGDGTTASGYASTAMGSWTTASGGFSTAMGLYSTAQAYASVVLGPYNVIVGDTAAWVATDPLFVIGNGADAGNPSNAMTVLKNGDTGIGTASPRTRLELGNDGAILATGTVGAGWTEPNLDAGTRLLWYPRKAAFRAGRVGGVQWNDANIGNYSVAMGRNTSASGDYSTAMGVTTSANGLNSTAMGSSTVASGTASTAMGGSSTASGDYSTAMGDLTTASGENSTAIGLSTTAQAYASVVLGRFNVISGTTNAWVAGEPLFVIGNGSGDLARSNALTVLKNGTTGIGTATPGQRLEVNGGVKLNTAIAKPLCSAATRGTLWFTRSGVGTKDAMEVCAKNNVEAYDWRQLW